MIKAGILALLKCNSRIEGQQGVAAAVWETMEKVAEAINSQSDPLYSRCFSDSMPVMRKKILYDSLMNLPFEVSGIPPRINEPLLAYSIFGSVFMPLHNSVISFTSND